MRLRGYRREAAVLAAVALAALPAVAVFGPQDQTRYELTRHVVLRGTLVLGPGLFDRAVHDGRTYSDKEPGMSFLAVPAFEVERLLGVARAPRDWDREGDLSLWGLRIATSGLLFLACAFLLGRVAEALVPRTGAATAATFGVATLAAPLAPTFFAHDAAAAFAFAGFVAAWRAKTRRRLVLAGALLGVAVLFRYTAALPAVAVAAYAAWRVRERVGWLLLGAVPPALLLGAYQWAAFGSPFAISYRFVANRYAERQRAGFFGIHLPTAHGLWEELLGARGLLVFSPVVLAAAAGLWLLRRSGRRPEATVAGVVGLAYVAVAAGYFLPYGGVSPGPRFLAEALPFVLLGLPFALRRAPRVTLALALLSAALTSAQSLTWALRKEGGGVIPAHPIGVLSETVWVFLGANRLQGGALVFLAAFAALALGGRELLRSE